LWPYMLMAWERWQSLPDERKQHYKRQAREYADRGRKMLDERRGRGRR
jgi:TRAP-type C4-dicarboxylate transport system substrate-binding protein